MATTFKFGNGNWAVKDGAALAYNDENGNFKPLPFDFTRASSATRVNKDGLIENVPSGKPRIDFLNNTSGHLLLEQSRKNDITDYTGASFSAFNGATITANDSVSPDGSANATLMTTTGGANELIQQASITILSGQSYTVSGYFKLKSGTLSDPDNAFKGLDGLNGGGITGSTFNSTLTSEWQRLSFTVTSSTTSGRVQIKCEDAAEILVWGLQVEQGSYATSIIKTEGSTVTRSADAANGAGNSQVFDNDTGVWFIDLERIGIQSGRAMMLANSSGSEQIRLHFDAPTEQIRFRDNKNGLATIGGNISMGVGTRKKIALKIDSTTLKVFADGSQVGSNYTRPTAFDIHLMYAADDAFKLFDTRFYNTALTDNELQALTS